MLLSFLEIYEEFFLSGCYKLNGILLNKLSNLSKPLILSFSAI